MERVYCGFAYFQKKTKIGKLLGGGGKIIWGGFFPQNPRREKFGKGGGLVGWGGKRASKAII